MTLLKSTKYVDKGIDNRSELKDLKAQNYLPLSNLNAGEGSLLPGFKPRPCGLVIAPGIHPLLSETASPVSECLRYARHRTG